MNTKLYVGNLSYDTTEEQLRQLFAEAGNVVSVALPTDRTTGQPRGFGFVEMGSVDDARKAINMVNGKTVDNRQLVVNESRPREGGAGGGGGGRGPDRTRSGGGRRW
jgi:RNA recognition motif-containing protein